MNRLFSWPLAAALLLASAAVQPGAIASQTAPNLAAPGPSFTATEPSLLASDEESPFSFARLAGTRWQLQQLSEGEAVPDGVAVTAEFDVERISGRSGCNQYFGGFTTKDPDGLTFSPLAATQMACPGPEMAVEQRYIGLLSKVDQIGFHSDGLMLTYRDGDVTDSLLFVPLKEDPL